METVTTKERKLSRAPAKAPSAQSHPANVPPKYAGLLVDPNVARWHQNLSKGSLQTSKEYLRILGAFCAIRGQTPSQFLAMGQRPCEDALHDFVNDRLKSGKAGSSTDYYASVIQSWMKWNDMPLRRAVKISHLNYNPRVKMAHIPTTDELRRVLALANTRQRTVIGLIAFAGVRPQAFGNFTGSDGLRFSDLPDTHFENGTLVFDQIPIRVVIREELSKAKHEYFTMLGPEGCEYLAAYVRQRVHAGEKVTAASPVLPSQRSRNPFMLAESVGDLMRRPMRRAGLDLAPYIWRSYFNNRTLLAERDGFQRDYRVFFMGHKGDMEHTYALRKKIGEEMIAQMRQAYSKAVPHLESKTAADQPDPIRRLAEAALRAGGATADQVEGLDIDGMDEAAVVQLMVDSMAKRIPAIPSASEDQPPNSPTRKTRQKVINAADLTRFLDDGWIFRAMVDGGQAIVETVQ